MIELREVTYKYPATEKPALEDIKLSVEQGEFLAIVGSNEAGKSTLCYTISGFVPHFFHGELGGDVQVAGLDLKEAKLNEWVLNVGLVFQNPFNQISGSKFTVFEEIAFGLENLGVNRSEMIERVEHAMERTGISDLADRSPYSLSGGQQQKVALTSILVMEPKVFVLDEPTSQLDPIGAREVFQVIKEMSQAGITVVMAEHKIEWVAEFADRVIALNAGQIILEGTPQEVLTSPTLPENGIGSSRYTQVAKQAREEGLYPEDGLLPISLDQAVAGFSGGNYAD
ncbi:MAG: ABC transporter ATP-binding protein [Chloroflexota bacterium]|nr:MAG: ABC transporter ATP-binding protein [Chloroflexota bacterium]